MGPGEYAALTAALLWAGSSLLYTQVRLTAWQLNFSKIVFAACMVFLQLRATSFFTGEAGFVAPQSAWFWLGLSGVVGLVIGDTFFFRSLQILGARKCLVVTTTSPIFAVFLGALFLKEIPGWGNLLGVVITVWGVGIVVSRQAEDDVPGLYPGSTTRGIVYGLAAAVCQAIGAVMARHAMSTCGPLEATFIRLFVAGAVAFPVVLVRSELKTIFQQVFQRQTLVRFVPAIICGTWFGVWLSQIALKYSTAAVAQTLLSTSPIFAIPLVWIVFGRRSSYSVFVGACIAVAGIFLISLPADWWSSLAFEVESMLQNGNP